MEFVLRSFPRVVGQQSFNGGKSKVCKYFKNSTVVIYEDKGDYYCQLP